MTTTDDDLEHLVAHLPAALAAERLATTRAEAVLMAEAMQLVRAGASRRSALGTVFPGKAIGNLLTRLKRFECDGAKGLLNSYVPAPRVVLTADVRARILGMTSLDANVTTKSIVTALARAGIVVGASTVDEYRREAGISRPRGPRAGTLNGVRVEPLANAGAMLLIAAEQELGAVAALTRAVGVHLAALPEPVGDVVDDCADRDEEGRFLSSYNTAKERTWEELGEKFETSAHRAGEKDLREMRVATSSERSRYLKDLTLTLLPLYVETARWSSLRHWKGEELTGIVGFAYQPSTLDKHAREMKLAGAAGAARSGVAGFWMDREARGESGLDALALVYVDTSFKPVWTRHFSKCAKVSSNGRTMPATATMMLHSGAGTPLVFRSYSGAVSLPHEVTGLLREVEQATGEGTVRRLVVMDREGHSVALFKELLSRGWSFVVPLRSQVTSPLAEQEQIGDWQPYGEHGDEVCDAVLDLRDNRPGEAPLRVRVVGRRRHRTGKVFWLATVLPIETFDAAAVEGIYFDRWPLEEHVFRDGKGRVGLDVHHGYGKEKVTHYAVVDAIEHAEARLRQLNREHREASFQFLGLGNKLVAIDQSERTLRAELDAGRAALRAATERGARAKTLLRLHERMADLHERLREVGDTRRATARAHAEAGEVRQAVRSRIEALEAKRRSWQSQQEVFTTDVELDEIMTSYKLTFMNLAKHVMRQYLGAKMELDVLIRSVLTLPGERIRTPNRETIRIYATGRDKAAMSLVQLGCARVNELGLTRGARRLHFELVTGPGAR